MPTKQDRICLVLCMWTNPVVTKELCYVCIPWSNTEMFVTCCDNALRKNPTACPQVATTCLKQRKVWAKSYLEKNSAGQDDGHGCDVRTGSGGSNHLTSSGLPHTISLGHSSTLPFFTQVPNLHPSPTHQVSVLWHPTLPCPTPLHDKGCNSQNPWIWSHQFLGFPHMHQRSKQ